MAGTSVCLRKVSGEAVWTAIAQEGVDHFCGAPIVLKMVADAAAGATPLSKPIKVMTAGAPPPASVLAEMAERGFEVTHVYGLTETYGPAVACDWREGWDALPLAEQARKRARQGIAYTVCEEVIVGDPATCVPVASDGGAMGEILFRGNVVMKGYHRDPAATETAFAGGWFHSGDLAVRYPDGHMQIRDRLKDIIISGGENISSIEVEDAIHHHPAVLAVAVVGWPDERWGEGAGRFRRDAARSRGTGRGRDHRLRARAARRLQGAEARGLHDLAPHLDRQDPEAAAPRSREGLIRSPARPARHPSRLARPASMRRPCARGLTVSGTATGASTAS